jgi:NTP pyrophosphatase (non-canonical NTP hydrolase)
MTAAEITLDTLLAICRGFNRRFPQGQDPFQVMTRLLEESGELAKEVNHFEGIGVKLEKYGPPDRAHLAKEILQTLGCVLQVAVHYQVEDELRAAIETSYQRLKSEGWIE